MYDGCFGLTHRPFAPVPRMDQYFAASTIEAARTTLARCIERAEGTGFVVGPSGTGKTLLCLMLAEQFRRSLQVAMLASGRLGTRRSLFQAILYELGRPYRYMDEGELRLAIVEHLTENGDGSGGMLLLVDEAHTLPPRLLDEIRLLSNLAQNGQPLVRLVLAGGSALEERFACPKLDSFSQRLSARCYLESFNRTETQEYVRWQIDTSDGVGAEMFPEEACQSIFQATGGVPRLINQLCDHSMLLADVAGQNIITPAIVDEAWADLQQLPTPWSCESQNESPDNAVIEFGTLDDASEPCAGASDGLTTKARVLRVATVEEEEYAPDEDSKPDQQIHRIERLLAEADEDFQPAGSIHPEIELRFEDAVHPFQEDFEHEEVVSDRYAAFAQKILESTAPVVADSFSSPVEEEGEEVSPCAVGEGSTEESVLPLAVEEEVKMEVAADEGGLPSGSEDILEQPQKFATSSMTESGDATYSSTVVPTWPEGSLMSAFAGDGLGDSLSSPVAGEGQKTAFPSPVAGEGQGVRASSPTFPMPIIAGVSADVPLPPAETFAKKRPVFNRPTPSEPIQRREYRQLFARLLQR